MTVDDSPPTSPPIENGTVQLVTKAENEFVSGKKSKSAPKNKTTEEKWSIDDLPIRVSTSESKTSWAKGLVGFLRSEKLLSGFEDQEISLNELLKRENTVIDLIRRNKK